jgi:hypothetical protein
LIEPLGNLGIGVGAREITDPVIELRGTEQVFRDI